MFQKKFAVDYLHLPFYTTCDLDYRFVFTWEHVHLLMLPITACLHGHGSSRLASWKCVSSSDGQNRVILGNKSPR